MAIAGKHPLTRSALHVLGGLTVLGLRRSEFEIHLVDCAGEGEWHLVVGVVHRRARVRAYVEGLVDRQQDRSGVGDTLVRDLFTVDTPGMKEFSEAYKQKFGSPPPNAFAPLGFDSVNLLATAIERAGSIQPDAVRSALANTRDFEGLVGKIAYSRGKRVPDKAVAVIKIDDGVETLV